MVVKYCRCRQCSSFRKRLNEAGQYSKWRKVNKVLDKIIDMKYIGGFIEWKWDFESGMFRVNK